MRWNNQDMNFEAVFSVNRRVLCGIRVGKVCILGVNLCWFVLSAPQLVGWLVQQTARQT